MKILSCIAIILFLSFSQHADVYIQPLGSVSDKHIDILKKEIKSVYGYHCVVLPAAPQNKKLYANSKTRYDANRILQHFASSKRTLVITEKDIAHYKSSRYPEWGIFGLGSLTNKTCVVSTFRLGPADAASQRLAKVTVHEIGHTLGLKHCTKSLLCVMQDAKGKIKTVDKESIQLCSACSLILNKKSKFVF
jgi:archaemetzincin